MKRYWIWIIPLLAALSAIWIQAALHGYVVGDFSPRPMTRVEGRNTAEATTMVPADSETLAKSSPHLTEPSQ